MKWPLVKVGDAYTVKRGTSISKKNVLPGSVPVVAGGLTYSYTHNTSNRSGHVVTISASGANAGFVNYWQESIFASDCSTVEAKNDKADIKYLYFFLKNKQSFINETMRSGAAQPHVYAKDIAALHIPLPPLAEQRRIAAALDKAEEIKRKREQAIAKLDQLAQSVFVEMFGDPIKNEKSYKCESLANLCHRIQIGPFGTQLHEEDYVENGIPLVNPTHIKNGKINPNNKLTITPEKHASLSQYHLKEGDLILGRRGEMGRCAIVNKDQENWLCGTGSLFLQLDRNKIHPLYLYSVLSSPSMRKHLESVAQGVTMANLNKDIIGNIKISLPSIQEQIIYEKAKDSSKYIFEMMDSSLKNIINLSSSLQHQAFTTGFDS